MSKGRREEEIEERCFDCERIKDPDCFSFLCFIFFFAFLFFHLFVGFVVFASLSHNAVIQGVNKMKTGVNHGFQRFWIERMSCRERGREQSDSVDRERRNRSRVRGGAIERRRRGNKRRETREIEMNKVLI